MRKRVHIMVAGRVQGVCYRMYTRDEAVRLRLTGIVRNLPNGCVEVVAEGEADALRALAAWCREGPPHARVTAVDATYTGATGEFDSFRITF